MKNVKELKKNVLQRMRYCWGENTIVFFITAGGIGAVALAWYMAADLLRGFGHADPFRRIDLTNGAVLAVTAAALVILYFTAEPLRYGVKWYRLQQVRGNSVHARSMFICYGSWKRAGQIFRLNICLFLRRLYFIVPLAAMLAVGVFFAAGTGAEGGSIVRSAVEVLVLLLAGCVICAAAVYNCKYAAVTYLFVLDPDAPPKELIAKSIRISKGKYEYIVDSVLSSAIWLPLCVLIFPLVFVVPYMQMVYTAAVNEIILSDGGSLEDENAGDSGKQVTAVAE